MLRLGEGALHALVLDSPPKMVLPTRGAGDGVPVFGHPPKARCVLKQAFAGKHLESLIYLSFTF